MKVVAHRNIANATQHSIHAHIFTLDERGVLNPQPTGVLRAVILKHKHYWEIEDVPATATVQGDGNAAGAHASTGKPQAAASPAPATPLATASDLTDEELEAATAPDAPDPADYAAWTQRDLIDALIPYGYAKKALWNMSMDTLRATLTNHRAAGATGALVTTDNIPT